MTHPNFRTKLEAIGYGLLHPGVLRRRSGVRFDLYALLDDRREPPEVPLFLVALLRSGACRRCSIAASWAAAQPRSPALLQATSLPFIVTAAEIGRGWT